MQLSFRAINNEFDRYLWKPEFVRGITKIVACFERDTVQNGSGCVRQHVDVGSLITNIAEIYILKIDSSLYIVSRLNLRRNTTNTGPSSI